MSLTVLHNGHLTVAVVPESGARIAELRDHHGRNWLVESERREIAYPSDVSPDDVRFEDGSRNGWDECVPSVSAEPGIADHGEAWFRPWTTRNAAPHCATWARDITCADGIPLRLVKTVRLLDSCPAMAVALQIENLGTRDASIVYSAHPLFRWTSDATVQLPGAGETLAAFGRPSGPSRWPTNDNLSRLRRQDRPENYKFFVRWTGRAQLTFDDVPSTLTLEQPDTETTPWIGLCVNRDHWPQPEPGESWIALEPTSSPTDSRREAVATATAMVVPAGGSRSWTTTVTIEDVA